MKTIFTWIIVILIVGAPAIGFYFVSKDSFQALTFEGKAQGSIRECTSVRSGTKRRRVPVVEYLSGLKVQGTVDEINYVFLCNDQIGKSVEVLYNTEKPEEAKINTFLEMWFLTSIFGIICLVWYPYAISYYIKKFK